MAAPRADALVANIATAAEALHALVVEQEEYVLADDQIRELSLAQLQLAAIVFAELGGGGPPEAEGEEGEDDPSSLTQAQEQGRIEGEQRDEMNELPAP